MNGSLLESIGEIQSGLDETLDQILLIAAGFDTKNVNWPPQTDNKHLENLKEFRREAMPCHLVS